MSRQRAESLGRALVQRLLRDGFREDTIARWFAVPQLTDVAFAPAPDAGQRPRRGLGGWIALWVAGEPVAAEALRPVPSADERAALVALRLATDDGVALRPLAKLLPWRGLLVASPPDEAFDVSALNVASTLDVAALAGRAMWDVGCGCGLLALVAARAGAAVLASDLAPELTAWAALNAALNGLSLETRAGDLWAAAAHGRRCDVVTFNAPLLRAPLAQAAGEPPRYAAATAGEAPVLAFLEGLEARLADHGRALLHAQLTPAVDAALDALATRVGVVSLLFAHAVDGTPHALTELRRDRPPGRRRVTVPLSPACPQLSRAPFDAQWEALAGAPLDDSALPRPAPWLELQTSARFDGGALRTLATRFGGVALAPAELALLQRLGSQTVAELALDQEARLLLQAWVDRGLVVLGRGA